VFPFRVSRDEPVGLGPRRDRDGLPEVDGDFRVGGLSPLPLSPRKAWAAAARVPTCVRVTARWTSPLALLGLGYGPKPVMACEGLPVQRRVQSKTFRSSLVSFFSSSKTRSGSCGLAPVPLQRAPHSPSTLRLPGRESPAFCWSVTRLLSWGFQRPPLHRHQHRLSTPSREPKPAPFGRTTTRSLHSFRPCRSSRLRRLPPIYALQVYCTLLPTMGFTTFQTETEQLLQSTSCTGPKTPAS